MIVMMMVAVTAMIMMMAVPKSKPAEALQLNAPERIVRSEIPTERRQIVLHVGLSGAECVRNAITINVLLGQLRVSKSQARVMCADGP